MGGVRVFDSLAGRYDSWYWRHPVTAENEVKAALKALAGARPCLEVGVGTGFFAERLGCAYGVDPSIGMLRLARARGVEVALARGEALPLRSGSVKGVALIVTLCFLDDPRAALAEAFRVLEPGGRLVACIVPAESPWGSRYRELAARGHPFYSHARLYTVDEAVNLIESPGFQVDEVIGTLSYPPEAREEPEDPGPYKRGVHGFACIAASRGHDVARKGGAALWRR